MFRGGRYPLLSAPIMTIVPAKVAGVDHVGLGSDFDGVPSLPEDMKDVAQLPNITYELLRRGYSEQDIRKILGENLMRAFAEVERVARVESRQISGEGSLRHLGATQSK